MKHKLCSHTVRFTRRDFCRGTVYASLGMAMGFKGLEGLAFAAENPSSIVVLIVRGSKKSYKID